ncbi:MAG TPA: ribosomal RNA small subunit methyltransferase A [Phycisphaerales bacterium]|nr:ribosomal RNA small subunit methyltransferase A [Phycisphaerales bacterium]
MQTKRDIERLLASAAVAPKHRLGQHFLIDLNLMRWLVEAAQIASDDVVLEVGCGTGSLTEALAQTAARVLAVECDDDLVRIARRQLGEIANVELLHTDVLAGKHALAPAVVDTLRRAREGHAGRLLLVANLPYSVAAPVMANLIVGPVRADGMIVTIQKEVGERMAADPGDGTYGPLSILMGATGHVEILRRLPPEAFWPRPQVESVIAAYRPDPAKARRIANAGLLMEVVQLFMTHRRKTLRGCVRLIRGPLADADWPAFFEQAAADPSQRPERLTPDQYVALANAAAKALGP